MELDNLSGEHSLSGNEIVNIFSHCFVCGAARLGLDLLGELALFENRWDVIIQSKVSSNKSVARRTCGF
ncbi:hypothetical protein I8752_20580 [Nostocaceae cyanobacterium CENA369]|uniref:Uncharacterized protein n=2 Tax=Dendronalium TaxID=2840442 RepID=A0A8J7LJ48_9NOST|nr:hypothetical protein [Dendronalium phyllosphericum CENA369]